MPTLKIELQPKQSEFDRTVDATPVTLFGGAKGGGKSMGLRLIMLKRRFQYAGSSGVIFRESFPEVEKNHIRPLFAQFPELLKYYNYGRKLLTLPNKSTLEFAYCRKTSDLKQYQGVEFNDIGVEEAGNWKEQWFQTLRGSNRSSKPGIKPRFLLTANPGGVGHAWLKRLFVSRKFNSRERAQDYAFVKALVTDNQALMDNDPDYITRLEAEPNEALRKAYRWGSWDIAAGQFFWEFNRDIHVIPRFDIPKRWSRFHSYDYGYGHPAFYFWWAVDEDGVVHVYREFGRASLRVDQQAEIINGHHDSSPFTVAGHDCWTKKGQKGPTIAEEFASHKIYLKQANINRIQGASQIRNRLAYKTLEDGKLIGPRVFITEDCPMLIDCIPRMVHDPNDVEDVLKVDSEDGDPNTGDDAYDAFRYGIMSRPMATPKTPTRKNRDSYDNDGPDSVPWAAV